MIILQSVDRNSSEALQVEPRLIGNNLPLATGESNRILSISRETLHTVLTFWKPGVRRTRFFLHSTSGHLGAGGGQEQGSRRVHAGQRHWDGSVQQRGELQRSQKRPRFTKTSARSFHDATTGGPQRQPHKPNRRVTEVHVGNSRFYTASPGISRSLCDVNHQ